MGKTTNRACGGRSRGAQLLEGKASIREIAEKIGCGKTFAHYIRTGKCQPGAEWTAKIHVAYGIPEEAWKEPPYVRDPVTRKWGAPKPLDDEMNATPTPLTPALHAMDSPLCPWLQRLIRDGTSVIDGDDAELKRTVSAISDTLTKHSYMLADVLEALRKHT